MLSSLNLLKCVSFYKRFRRNDIHFPIYVLVSLSVFRKAFEDVYVSYRFTGTVWITYRTEFTVCSLRTAECMGSFKHVPNKYSTRVFEQHRLEGFVYKNRASPGNVCMRQEWNTSVKLKPIYIYISKEKGLCYISRKVLKFYARKLT